MPNMPSQRSFGRTVRRTDGHGQIDRIVILIKNIYMRLVILIKNIYTLWGRKRFLLPVTYFLTNLYILLLYE